MSGSEPRRTIALPLLGCVLLALLLALTAWQLARELRVREEPQDEGPRTVLVVLVDRFRADRLGAYGADPDPTPRLTALAAESTVFERAETPHLSTSPAVTTVLHGSRPDLLALGRHGLPDGSQTLAQDLRRAGCETVGVVSLRQLAGSISGLDQGFDTWSNACAPADGDPAPVAAAVDELLARLAPALEDGRPVFAFLHLGALRTGEPSDPMAALGHLQRALAPFLTGDPELRGVFQGPATSDTARVERVRELLGRRRGAPEWRALQRASNDAALAEADVAIGRLLDVLAQHGRLRGAVVVVAGTQGALVEQDASGDGAAPQEALVRVPLLLRQPGGRDAGRSTAEVSLAWIPSTLRRIVVGRGPGLDLRDPPARAASGSGVTDPDRAGSATPPGDASSPGPGLHLGLGPRAAGAVSLEVRSMTPALRPGLGELRERLEFTRESPTGGPEEVDVPCDARRPSVLSLSTGGAPVPEQGLLVGARPLSGSSLLRLPDPRGEAWAATEGEPLPWDVDVAREGGATVLRVGGEGVPEGAVVRVLLERYPPVEPARPLGVALETGGAVEPVPGRLDAVAIVGPAPLSARLDLRSTERPALSVAIDGVQVPTSRMRYGGRRFTRGDLVLFLSEWFPEAMADLECGREESEAALGQHPEVAWWLRRDPRGPGRPLSPGDLVFVARLKETE